ncbi:helix-turn-helix domain-containing protein [Cryobacterium sp. Hz9]|uniref:helix-turn-helix domain-containing protein n=1 Tax=Cryobacterium sp. Hz9 TaxID=1259167 RepID=UPI00141B309C
MITVQDWAEIRHLHVSEGMSVRAIAKQLGLSRTTVTRAVHSAGPPQYRRDPCSEVAVCLGVTDVVPASGGCFTSPPNTGT